jgi:hypothetical protein
MKQPTQAEYEAILESVRAANPGTEIWEGGIPKTGDRYIYRPSTRAESKIFRKLTREQREKGELADFDVPNDMLATACVVWPYKDNPDPEGITLAKLMAARPMISASMADDIVEVSGAGERATAKKL